MLLAVPLLLLTLGSLFDSNALRQLAGLSSLPVLVLIASSFVANFLAVSSPSRKAARRLLAVENALRSLQTSPTMEMRVVVKHQPEFKISYAGDRFEFSSGERLSFDEARERLLAADLTGLSTTKRH